MSPADQTGRDIDAPGQSGAVFQNSGRMCLSRRCGICGVHARTAGWLPGPKWNIPHTPAQTK